MREPDKSKTSAWWRMRSACVGLGRDRDGSALLYTTLSLPVLIGFAILAIDGSRLMNLHSHLQHAADALALAGAGELDRAPGARDRAKLAIENLVENDQRYGDAGAVPITCPDVDDVNNCDVIVRFLTELPVNDSDPIPQSSPPVTTDDAVARFVEVTVNPQDFTTLLPAAFVGGSTTSQTDATAVAGFDLAICELTPMFMCNPFEPSWNNDVDRTTELYEHIADRDKRRRLIEFKSHDGTETWSPGNFGYLEAALGPGAKELGESIARVNPVACFVRDGLYTKPGNTTSIRHAFNVRFDLYHGSFKKTEPDYRPARNVRKGYKVDPKNGNPGNACDAYLPDPPDPANVMGLPRDSCFLNDPQDCNPDYYSRVGEGDWDFDSYWQVNFGTTPKPTDEFEVEFSNDNRPTRYEIYRYEIEHDENGDGKEGDLLTMASPGGEIGAPQCHKDAAKADDDPDRRIVTGAIINCRAAPVTGGAGGPYKPLVFARFFMTEPMGESQESLWLEMVEFFEPDDESYSQDQVQLYR